MENNQNSLEKNQKIEVEAIYFKRLFTTQLIKSQIILISKFGSIVPFFYLFNLKTLFRKMF